MSLRFAVIAALALCIGPVWPAEWRLEEQAAKDRNGAPYFSLVIRNRVGEDRTSPSTAFVCSNFFLKGEDGFINEEKKGQIFYGFVHEAAANDVIFGPEFKAALAKDGSMVKVRLQHDGKQLELMAMRLERFISIGYHPDLPPREVAGFIADYFARSAKDGLRLVNAEGKPALTLPVEVEGLAKPLEEWRKRCFLS